MKPLLILTALLLAGCSTVPTKYQSGANFDKDGNACGTRQSFYRTFPCPSEVPL